MASASDNFEVKFGDSAFSDSALDDSGTSGFGDSGYGEPDPYANQGYSETLETSSSRYHGRRSGFCTRRRLIVGGVLAILVVVGAVVGVMMAGGGGGGGGDSHVEDPALFALLESTMQREGISTEGMNERGTYKYRAWQWLAKNQGRDTYERAQLLQRFTLACLYYSTYEVPTVYNPEPSPWASSDNWMTDAHECQWDGIQCTTRLAVAGISLEQNNLSGALPEELVLLKENLNTLDMTTNMIYMESTEMDWFGKLTMLETMLLDDNFLSTDDGLPSSLTSLTALQKLRLSYNLLEGELDGDMFANLQALTHLEVESNYISGTIPLELGSMPNLVYLYMRRNSFSGTLDFIKEGNLPELFALWLDTNEAINGTIPTEVGLLTGLASLSLTNNTLSGPIPTEMGNLLSLRRLWLYGNELTGTVPAEMANLRALEIFEVQDNNLGGSMPQGVCTNVLAATYDRKSLEADCKEITCDCCTKCHEQNELA